MTEIEHEAGAGTNWDVVELEAPELQRACSLGLVQKLDWKALGGKNRFLPQAASDCGAGAWMRSTVLAWDRTKIKGTPSWPDFWDVAKYPGKRGLRRSPRGNLEIALMADGVAPGDVYATLRTKDGLERAFRKLEQLKPYLVWWEDEAQAPALITSGEVLMSSAPSDQVLAATRAKPPAGPNPPPDFAIQWGGSLYRLGFWALMTGTQRRDAGMRFLTFVSSPDQQAALVEATGLGSPVPATTDKLPKELQAFVPGTPANLQNALEVDDSFWRDNGARLEARFAEWLKH
jgi:putative spermidine/putrescine transport system substrate-binding protein